jgi:signal transduction histidine kinase
MFRFNRLLWSKPSRSWSYAIAVLSAISALISSRWLYFHFGAPPGTLFFCAVMLSAWFGGLGPGLLATAFSTLAFHYYFLPPIYSLALKPGEMPKIVMYLVGNLFIALLSAAQRNATESLGRVRDDLRGTVQDLQTANETLHAASRERKYAENQLRRSEAYLAEAQRLTHTGSWACDIATREMRHSSDEHSRLYGFDPERGAPSFEECVRRIHPDDRPRVIALAQEASSAGEDFEAHFRILLPDGATRYVFGTGHPVFSASGDVGEFVGIVMDMTERKQADEERERLRQAQADLAHINRVTTMGELTASLAHEIKQPISAAVTDARTCLRWLGRDVPDLPEAREAASRVVNDVTRAADIIGKISLLFKKGAAQRELIDVNELAIEMIVLLRSEANRYLISLRTELADNLPRVLADRVQLQQVFMNLMLNGFDAMKGANSGGELTIKSGVCDGQLLISVCDTGVGLAVEQAEQVFNAFFTTKDNGTGMGLPISRSIIESHGGRLWATGVPGIGATFQFTLPAAAVAAHA